MRTIPSVVVAMCFVVGAAARPVAACGAVEDRLARAAQDAVYGEGAARTSAIATLRSAGPEGLRVLAEHHADLLRQLRPTAALGASWLPAFPRANANLYSATDAFRPSAARPSTPTSAADRLRTALDEVAQQRGACTSLLYWYTDLNAAKEAARRLHRPILSLRLLGKLTDEYSCANSRFFRTVLYANRDVSDTLRRQFVLHWSSERPVPVVTIDFGDGRVLKRTLTGNSAHYVLDANGRPVDVLPGLYGPKAFLRAVGDAESVAHQVSAFSDSDALRIVREFHRAKMQAAQIAWSGDLAKAGGADLHGRDLPPSLDWLNAATTDAQWTKIALLHADDARLDESSRQLLRDQLPLATRAMALTITKAKVEDPLLAMVAGLERDVAKDSIRNEYRLHGTVHMWFAYGGRGLGAFAELNSRVYAELFLTPAYDPWMGLAPAVYTGLDGAGLTVSKAR